ncbi:hypothetical protein [Brevundimonas sp.]|uniref:hypothetical protein n=1 Tax=Brevundimonas sp. TaxID=1871086 RepID=UPI001A32AED5|nr:hypothetical protein [Brevundimonas sp.]MBJ7483991.1 hypothetical protein [Brevundimonas sp.]
MKTGLLVLVITIGITGCVRLEDNDGESFERIAEFDGRLIELNGKATTTSRVSLELYEYSSGLHPKRYDIRSDCFDAGYFDESRNQYVSGFAPVTPQDGPSLKPHDRYCDPDDVSRQRQLREWMFSGAKISIRPDDGRAVIETQTGATAVFLRNSTLTK